MDSQITIHHFWKISTNKNKTRKDLDEGLTKGKCLPGNKWRSDELSTSLPLHFLEGGGVSLRHVKQQAVESAGLDLGLPCLYRGHSSCHL